MWFCESCACECVGSVETETNETTSCFDFGRAVLSRISGLKSVNTAFGYIGVTEKRVKI